MAFEFFKRLVGADGQTKTKIVPVNELAAAAEEYRIRELAFWACTNLIANALGRCEFRTYENHKEAFGSVYWMWNYEPNINQNSTAFLHKLVAQLYQDNEALIVPLRPHEGIPAFGVADLWSVEQDFPSIPHQYTGVVVGDKTFQDPFPEKNVIHLTLNHVNIKPVMDGLYNAYVKLIKAAVTNYTWSNGQHWKVTVNQLASGEAGWAETFQQMVTAQIKPFLESNSAVLPEMDGWKYENVDKKVEGGRDAKDIRALFNDVLEFTANAFCIPPVLLLGQVQGTQDAVQRFLTACVDPLADQLSEEITRKFYGFEQWKNGSRIRVDTSTINHFDLLANAPNVEKLIGSGYSYNDVQRAVGMPVIDEPWANEHFLTRNFAKAETVLKGEQPNE